MGRLIDAEALLKKFCVNSEGRRIPEVDCDNHEITVSIKDIKKIIREQPTAYDVEKVVAELERWSTEVEITLPISKDTIETKVVASGNAIDIVKAGGVE